MCESCAREKPCLECQKIVAQHAPRPSPRLAQVIAALLVLYAVCTVAVVPLTAAADWTNADLKMLTSPQMLALISVETIYAMDWLALIIAFLAWYAWLLDWGRSRGLSLPGTAAGVFYWFVPLANFVLPFIAIRQIQVAIAPAVPVRAWWLIYCASIVSSTLRFANQRVDLITLSIALSEIAAAFLCWRVVTGFTRHALAWNPSLAIEQRA